MAAPEAELEERPQAVLSGLGSLLRRVTGPRLAPSACSFRPVVPNLFGTRDCGRQFRGVGVSGGNASGGGDG